jgi:RNA polymerase sigma-70 factor, ECF subfamily
MTKSRPDPQLSIVAFDSSKVATQSGGPVPPETEDCFHAYRRELDYLIGSLRRLGVPPRDLEDVLHEVFLVMLKRWEDYDRGRPLRPWLFGIAFRVAWAQRRRGTREVLGEDHQVAYEGEAPDEALAGSEARQLLLRALAAVPLERRAVLILREVDEVSMRDIAHQLEIPLFTAYSRLRKARKELDLALARFSKGGRHGG